MVLGNRFFEKEKRGNGKDWFYSVKFA